MKNQIILLIALVFGISQSYAQTNYGDFETISPGFGTFGEATYDIVANPDASGINTSANVGQTITAEATWDGMWVSLGGTIDFSSSTVFSLMVYSDVAGTVLWKLEKEDDANVFVEVPADYTATGTWQELTFDFSGAESDLYGKFVMFFDFDGIEVGNYWYFDNLTGPAFIAGSDVDVKFTVTDILGVSDVTIEVDNDGSQIQMYDDGTNGDFEAADYVWTAIVTGLAGSNILDPTAGAHTWDVYADGELAEGADDLNFQLTAGQGESSVAFSLAPSQPDLGNAIPFELTEEGSPVVDGEIDAVWDLATKFILLKTFTGESVDNLNDLSAYWKAGWDANGIYILVHVTADDVHFTDGTYGEAYEQDIIEVYFDMNVGNLDDGNGPNDNSSYDGENLGHYQFGFHMEPDLSLPGWSSDSERGFVLNEDNSVIQELFIAWSDIPDANGNIFTSDGSSLLGFDVYVQDNDGPDNGPARSRKVWMNDGVVNGENWSNMDEAGELRCQLSLSSVDNVAYESGYNIYPNPAQNYVNIFGLTGRTTITISNVTGAIVKSTISNSENIEVSLNELNEGVYFIHIGNGQSSSIHKIIKY